MYTFDTISVSGLNMYVKSIIDGDKNLSNLYIEGEISNFVRHFKSGHLYFSLKDEKSTVKAVMFSQSARFLRFEPKEGMKVICRARLGVYESMGQYQLYIEDMQPDGIGAYAVKFEQLKEKLSKEGLFNEEYKKPIPKFPKKIGVITSCSGAAIRDIINVISRRYPICEIVTYDTLVQGSTAASQMCRAIEFFNTDKCCDVIILGRGGGAYEDLHAFNDEMLARAVFASDIPIITGIGHETDFTICDFTSSLRAPTPSAAAELAVPDIEELKDTFLSYYQTIKIYEEAFIDEKKRILSLICNRLNAKAPTQRLNEYSIMLDEYTRRLFSGENRLLSAYENKLSRLSGKLNVLNPLNVLLRGYSVVYKDKKVIKSADDVKVGDKINIRLASSNINCSVNEIERNV